MLGTLLFVGVKTTGPSLQHSADVELRHQHLSDLQITSTGGITDEDVALAEKIPGANIETGSQLFYSNKEKNEVVHLYSYEKDDKQNKLTVEKGRLPEKNTEIVLDATAQDKGYKLGDAFSIPQKDDLKHESYQIVGFVSSPLYLNNSERGVSNVGSGSVDFFAYLPQAEFKSEVRSTIYVSFDNVAKKNTYTASYQDQMEKNADKVKEIFADRPEARYQELKKQINDEVAPAKEKIADGQRQLADAQRQIDQASDQLNAQKAQLAALPEPQRSAAEEPLNQAQQQIQDNQAQLDTEKKSLADAETQVADGEKALDDLKVPEYTFSDRDDVLGFKTYGDLATQINAIANVFPVFFFFIAALVTFTTMTRMVEENRREVGTLKALGYTKREISKKYTIYASLAAVLGIVLGSAIGILTLPKLIFGFMTDQYTFSSFALSYNWTALIQAAVAFFIASWGSSMVVLMRELAEKPAQLLQPKAPKPGKRILLEYIPFIWNRLSFNQKVSYRNLFRYKSRMVMAIIGIAGCAGLMFAGVGLKTSLQSITDKQEEIVRYDAIVSLDEDKVQDRKDVQNVLDETEDVAANAAIQMQTLNHSSGANASESIPLMAFESKKEQETYLDLKDLDKQPIAVSDKGVLVTQGLAKENDLKKGDDLKLTSDDGETYNLKIAGVVENYTGSYVYTTKAYFDKVSPTPYVPNTILFKTKQPLTESQENQLAEKLLETDVAVNTSYVSQQVSLQQNMTQNLDSIVLIFVVLSGLLAFIVLYNLTNINISERVRELSTIKVLGFFDKEVTMYIVRENIIFTLIGIVFGYGIGYLLTGFILDQIAMSGLTFPLVITWTSYGLSAVLTIAFTVIVMIVTHFKLKHINMIDALKSNE